MDFSYYIIITFSILCLVYLILSLSFSRIKNFNVQGGSRIFFNIFGLAVFMGAIIFFAKDYVGYPVKMKLPDEWYLVSHHIDMPNDTIYVWYLKKDENIPVSISIPYSEDSRKKLEKGKSMKEESGGTNVGFKRDDSMKSGNNENIFGFQVVQLKHEILNPKRDN